MTNSKRPARSVALVTGASSGIGLEFARLLAARGYDLVLVARRSASLETIAHDLTSKHGIQVFLIPCDLAETAAAKNIHSEVARRGLVIDVLINNAGFNSYGPFVTVQLESELNMIQVNVSSLVTLTRLFLQDMVQRRSGRILNVASTASFGPAPNAGVYASTKGFVLSFSESLSEELKGTGVTVSVLCPGPTQTEFGAKAGMLGTKIFKGKLANARDVARAGIEAMLQGRMTTIIGFANKFRVWSMRLVPRSVVVKVAAGLLQSDHTANPA